MINETHRATRLRLTDLPGTVAVVPTPGLNEMRLQMRGPQDQLDRIRRDVTGDTLTVSGPATGAGGGMTMVVGGRGGFTSISNMSVGGVVIAGGGRGIQISGVSGPIVVNGKTITADGGSAPFEEIAITVEVPPRTPVTIDDGAGGSYRIGDTHAPLDLKLKAHGQVTAGQVAELRVNIVGSADVTVTTVTGQAAQLNITGSGDIEIRDGQVANLNAAIAGSGSIAFGGTATDAGLTISGSGSIRVNKVTRNVMDQVSGSGRVYVHVPPPRTADSFWG